jgi:hypothetical protein
MKTQQCLPYIVELRACYQYKNNECCTEMLLWQIYVAGINITYLGLHVKCPTYLLDFNHIWHFSTDIYNIKVTDIKLYGSPSSGSLADT